MLIIYFHNKYRYNHRAHGGANLFEFNEVDYLVYRSFYAYITHKCVYFTYDIPLPPNRDSRSCKKRVGQTVDRSPALYIVAVTGCTLKEAEEYKNYVSRRVAAKT